MYKDDDEKYTCLVFHSQCGHEALLASIKSIASSPLVAFMLLKIASLIEPGSSKYQE